MNPRDIWSWLKTEFRWRVLGKRYEVVMTADAQRQLDELPEEAQEAIRNTMERIGRNPFSGSSFLFDPIEWGFWLVSEEEIQRAMEWLAHIDSLQLVGGFAEILDWQYKATLWDQYAIYDNDKKEEILVKDLITAYEKLEEVKTWLIKAKAEGRVSQNVGFSLGLVLGVEE